MCSMLYANFNLLLRHRGMVNGSLPLGRLVITLDEAFNEYGNRCRHVVDV